MHWAIPPFSTNVEVCKTEICGENIETTWHWVCIIHFSTETEFLHFQATCRQFCEGVACVGRPVVGHDEVKSKEKSNDTHQGRKLCYSFQGWGLCYSWYAVMEKYFFFFFLAYVISHHNDKSLDSTIFVTMIFKYSRILGLFLKSLEYW